MGDYCFPLVDAEDPDIAEILWQAVQRVDDQMRSGKTVLVHCTSGLSRSCAVVMGYLAARRGYTVDGALDLVREARPGVMPEQGLLKALRSKI
jgi:dual specificity phosphatase 12